MTSLTMISDEVNTEAGFIYQTFNNEARTMDIRFFITIGNRRNNIEIYNYETRIYVKVLVSEPRLSNETSSLQWLNRLVEENATIKNDFNVTINDWNALEIY